MYHKFYTHKENGGIYIAFGEDTGWRDGKSYLFIWSFVSLLDDGQLKTISTFKPDNFSEYGEIDTPEQCKNIVIGGETFVPDDYYEKFESVLSILPGILHTFEHKDSYNEYTKNCFYVYREVENISKEDIEITVSLLRWLVEMEEKYPDSAAKMSVDGDIVTLNTSGNIAATIKHLMGAE